MFRDKGATVAGQPESQLLNTENTVAVHELTQD